MIDFRVSSLFLLFVAAALAGCVGAQDAGEFQEDRVQEDDFDDGTGGVRGLVVDDGLNPVAGAEIAILDAADLRSTTTDVNGAFSIGNVPTGKQQLAVQKLGFESAAKVVDIPAGEVVEVHVTLVPIAVAEPRTEFLIGEGYFACGAYLVVTSWGNLHACVWDEHKPRYNFEVDKQDLMGIMQELVWEQTSALTSQYLSVRLEYNPVCDPFCGAEERFGAKTDTSPVRMYTDMEGDLDSLEEDLVPLSSMTFPDGEDTPVIVFQQRMTHYVTIFYGEHGELESYSGIPDA